MKAAVLMCFVGLLTFNQPLFAQKNQQEQDYAGFTRQDLNEAGFTRECLISEDRVGEEEYLTFSDWTTLFEGDTITFYLVEGKVKEWFRGVPLAGIEP
ncbi:MAG: hypothetical protein PHE97_04070 [Candidatus Omnitrophica bacterium]|nr:hypothetical protein [Candidatus Omnitrophota bacterium]